MNRKGTFSVLCALLLSLVVANVYADQTDVSNKSTPPQTVTIGGSVYPAFPEGYNELLVKIEQLEKNVQAANNELTVLANEKIKSENSFNYRYRLSRDLREKLMSRIKENPDLTVSDVNDLRPVNFSYNYFARIIQDCKALVTAFEKWQNKQTELENLEKELNLAKDDSTYKKHLFTFQILFKTLSKALSKHPDYNKYEAEFPSDDLTKPISDLKSELEQFSFFFSCLDEVKQAGFFQEDSNNESNKSDTPTYKEFDKILLDLAEFHWVNSRPCLLNSEPARVALQFWTAYMTGDYDKAKELSDDSWNKIIDESKSDPKKRRLPLIFSPQLPINPHYQGVVTLVSQNTSTDPEENKNESNQEEVEILITPVENQYTSADYTARFFIDGERLFGTTKSPQKADDDIEKFAERLNVITMINVNGKWKAHCNIDK